MTCNFKPKLGLLGCHQHNTIQESLTLASIARDASSTAAEMRGKVGSEFET